MKKIVFLLAVLMMAAIGAKAQKGIEVGGYGRGADSIRCQENVSLFIQYANAKNFQDALPFWKKVYEECPGAHVNTYIQGQQIINWQISQETDPAKREELINAMIKLFDDRLKYFGNDRRYPKDNVIARKAAAYNTLKGENADFSLIYKWTGEAIEEFKEKTDPMAVSRYMFASFKLLQENKEKHKEQYINDFLKCSDIFNKLHAAAVAANKTTDIDNITGYKAEMEQNFFGSGVAECDVLIGIYAPRVEENKTNLEFLKATMILLRKMQCNETDLFITASEYAHKIEPTPESAMGLGSKALKNNDNATAEKYFNEAIAMTDDSDTKADLYFALLSLAVNQKQYPKAKQLFQKCIAENPNHGKAYFMIANAYALGGRNISDDTVLAKCVYYAVVDKLERARQLDPSLAAEVNKLIAQYSKGFPTKEEVFMHPEIEAGGSYTVGGWINETVKIR